MGKDGKGKDQQIGKDKKMKERDITITIHHGLNEMEIELIQEIEKKIDEALGQLGFARTGTSKENKEIKLYYYAFAICTRKGKQ